MASYSFRDGSGLRHTDQVPRSIAGATVDTTPLTPHPVPPPIWRTLSPVIHPVLYVTFQAKTGGDDSYPLDPERMYLGSFNSDEAMTLGDAGTGTAAGMAAGAAAAAVGGGTVGGLGAGLSPTDVVVEW